MCEFTVPVKPVCPEREPYPAAAFLLVLPLFLDLIPRPSNDVLLFWLNWYYYIFDPLAYPISAVSLLNGEETIGAIYLEDYSLELLILSYWVLLVWYVW